MEFKDQRSIYLQIADSLRDHILEGIYSIGVKLPSVREMAAELGVNPNTVMRSYTELQQLGFVNNKRGIGFFVSEDSIHKIKAQLRNDFLENELPRIVKKMGILDIDLNMLTDQLKDVKSS